LTAAYGLTRFLGSLLFEVSASDPSTYALTAVGLISAAVLASYIPSRRASAIDPNETLRSE
jgi:putative ABC transport system permease protein